MQANDPDQLTQPRKQTAFTLMNNVRDYCEQTGAKRLLMFVLATYCNRKGVCWPSNETLAAKMHIHGRTIQRLLSQLAKAGEIQILKHGAGRNQRRYISLSRYTQIIVMGDEGDEKTRQSSVVFKHDTYCHPNSHLEQPPLSTRETHHFALRAANGALSVSKYDSEEQQKLKPFREILSAQDPRWLPINKYSVRVSQALELVNNADAMKMLCEAAARLVAEGLDSGSWCVRMKS